jgi:hypothetical protein
VHDLRTGGVAVAPAVQLSWPTRGSTVHYVQISAAGVAESGLYFLRVTSADGRVGYAPLILRPRTLGEHKVAVVLSTNTWQAYNFSTPTATAGATAGTSGGANPTVDLTRPYLDFGVPVPLPQLGPELHLVAEPHRQAGRLPHDDDLERVASGDALRRAYDLVVFPGHEEYVSARPTTSSPAIATSAAT